jgi:hypothetical protein
MRSTLRLLAVFASLVTLPAYVQAQNISWAKGYPQTGANFGELVVSGTIDPGKLTLADKAQVKITVWRTDLNNKGTMTTPFTRDIDRTKTPYTFGPTTLTGLFGQRDYNIVATVVLSQLDYNTQPVVKTSGPPSK